MSKGFAWIPVAIGIIFLVQILIFSLSFTKITIFSREVLDANIVFEGDELETYVRSIDNSVQLSIAQAIYEFIREKTQDGTKVWQNYGTSEVPTPTDTSTGLMQRIEGYMNTFLQAHASFPGAKDIPAVAFPAGIGEGTLTIKDDRIDMFFEPEVELKKTFVGVAQYSRKFVAESTLATVFGEMMDSIRNLIENDVIGKFALHAIGKDGGDGEFDPKTCKLDSYIDDVANCKEGLTSPESTLGVCGKLTQTDTRGSKQFSDVPFVEECSKDIPTPARCDSRPSAEQVYEASHHNGYDSGEASIKSLADQYMACLERKLDEASTDYTVAFEKKETDSLIKDLSCGDKKTGGICNCEDVGTCLLNGERVTKWRCETVYIMTCDYRHYDKADLTVRYQEDGFVYWWGDSIKIIFKAISGNMQGVSIPPTGLPFGAPGTGSGLGSQPQQPT